jgi:hypothetical protein
VNDEEENPPKAVVYLPGSPDGLQGATRDMVVRAALATGLVIRVEDCEAALSAPRPVSALRIFLLSLGGAFAVAANVNLERPLTPILTVLILAAWITDRAVSRW